MPEFMLPDRIRDLKAVEAQLREELSHKEADYKLVCHNLPPGSNAHQTPAFYCLLVAHRRWQHAYEKLLRTVRSAARA